MISDEQADFYEQNGYLVIEDVLDAPALAELRGAVDELVDGSRQITENDDLYDLEDSHGAAEPRVRRLKSPDQHHEAFRRLVAQPVVVAILERLWDTGVRFDKAKLNMKSAGYGAPVEWHQDWAFYPHTNDDLAAVGFMLDDVTEENGPLLVVPGSHRGPVYSHHVDGVFCGAMDLTQCDIDVRTAIPLTGRAGSITIHHVRAVHGSATNTSDRPRRLLLHQYCASDAWPLLGVADYDAFRAGLLSGDEVDRPRMESVPVLLPYPAAAHQGSIYENQRDLGERYFPGAAQPTVAASA